MDRLAAQFRDVRSQVTFLKQTNSRNAFGACLSAKPRILQTDASQSQDRNSVPANSAQEFQARKHFRNASLRKRGTEYDEVSPGFFRSHHFRIGMTRDRNNRIHRGIRRAPDLSDIPGRYVL